MFSTWWTVRIFFIFFCLGEGQGESEAPGRGGARFFFIENPRRGGGFSHERGGGGGGAERLSPGNFWGGAFLFFRNAHQVFSGVPCFLSKKARIGGSGSLIKNFHPLD